MKGVIWHIYRNQQKGMIRGDDGELVPLRKSALSGAEFHTLSSGQRVSYRVQDDWLGKEAVEVQPLPIEGIAGHGWNEAGSKDVPGER
jgi:cold shock CspA family protein